MFKILFINLSLLVCTFVLNVQDWLVWFNIDGVYSYNDFVWLNSGVNNYFQHSSLLVEIVLFFFLAVSIINWIRDFSFLVKDNRFGSNGIFKSELELKYISRFLTLYIFYYSFLFYKRLFYFVLLDFLMSFFDYYDFKNIVLTQTLSSFSFVDYYSAFSRFLVIFTFVVSYLIFFRFALLEYDPSVETPILLGFILFFCVLLVTAFDFFFMYLLLEVLTLLVCTIIASNYRSSMALEASIKYLVVSSLASGFIIYGISWIFILSNQTNFWNFKLYTYGVNVYLFNDLTFPVFLISLGFLIKLGAFPFSLWTPDVYEGSPVFVTFFFIVCLKTALILVFFRLFFFTFYDFSFCWRWLFLVSALGSFTLGSLGAYNQKVLKRFFAYTSLNQLGFILASVCSVSADVGLSSALVFLFVYIINNILFFYSIFIQGYEYQRSFFFLTDLKGFAYENSKHSFFISLSLFSFIGLPPLSGFFSKLLVLLTLARSDLFFIIAVALIANGISSFYYLRVIKLIWFDGPVTNTSFIFRGFNKYKTFSIIRTPETRTESTMDNVLILSSIFVLFFGFYLDFFINISRFVSQDCIYPLFWASF